MPRSRSLLPEQRKKLILAIIAIGLAVTILFQINLYYLYGSLYHEVDRVSAFHILTVDYDGGIIGESLSQAYQQLKGIRFPTLITGTETQYPTPDAVLKAVRDGKYWAAIYSMPGASERLSAALLGGTAATAYDASDAFTYVWNEVKYPAFSQEVIQGGLKTLIAAAGTTYCSINGSSALKSLAQTDDAAIKAYLIPIMASEINIQPTNQGAKILYNTISMAMPVLQNLFFVVGMRFMFIKFEVQSRLSTMSSGLLRLTAGVIYTFIGSLTMTGYIWAYREDWAVSGTQFVLTWTLLWLLFHIHYLAIEAAIQIIPIPAMPFLLMTWVFLNITSSITPFEINPGFYRFGYAFPAHEAYQVLTDIWSGGAVPQLYHAMPVLFSWWVLLLVCDSFSHRRACMRARNIPGDIEKGSATASASESSHPETLTTDSLE
ncbi:hypothetical protein BDZ45DRAFT_589415 [Acephala macrosclerotiorum]|nr:hypothetical protein BDZ45DRAFT_589415 [Acephala macrosclerotiorum]